MSQALQLGLRPPVGVTFTQWADGTIVFTYSHETLTALRAVLDTASQQLRMAAIERVRAERDAELEKQKLPKTKLEELTDELAALEADDTPPSLEIPNIADIAEEVPPSTLDS